MTRKLTYRLLTFFILALMFSSADARATSVANAQDVSKTTFKAPVVAATTEDDTSAVKIDDKGKPAPKPKPKPGPRDDGDGD